MSSEQPSSTLAEDVVGFPTALATSIGLIIAASVVLTATQGFGVAGGTFAIAIAIVIAHGKLYRRQESARRTASPSTPSRSRMGRPRSAIATR